MACFSVTKLGFITIDDLVDDIVKEMTGNVAGGATNSIQYFEKVHDGNGTNSFASNRVVILKSKFPVDPLANAAAVGLTTVSMIEPGWRICFNIESNGDKMHAHAGTELQLTDNGDIARLTNRSIGTGQVYLLEPAGNLANSWTYNNGSAPEPNDFNQFWLNRDATDANNPGAYPMSYLLTMTNRGVFLAVWEGSQEENPQGLFPTATDHPNPDSGFGLSPVRWLLIQRPVDRLTGHVRGGGALRENNDPRTETSRCPVLGLSGYGAPPTFVRVVVRENDVVVPSRKKLAAVQTEDNPPMLNPYQQQSLTETGEFIVTFINAITTTRFRYADELDMLGTVSARVVGAGTRIIVRVYDETYNDKPMYREYTALYATERNGNGMRLMVLTRLGIDNDNPEDLSQEAIDRNNAVEDSHIFYTPPQE